MPDTTTAESDEHVPRPREQELLWPARQHPDDLILPRAHPMRFPGKWVAIYEGSIPADQRNALFTEGFRCERIDLLANHRAQVIIREEHRPDREGSLEHEPTNERYEQYDPRAPRSYREAEERDGR